MSTSAEAARARATLARRARSIAAPILALAIAAVALATAVLFAVTFSGPPPRMPARGVENIAAILRTGAQRPGPGPRLHVFTARTPPAPAGVLHRDERARARLARALGVPAAQVVALTDDRVRGFEDAFFGDFAFARAVPGGWRVVKSPRMPRFTPWHLKTLAAMLLTLALLAVPAWLIARAISRPLRELARAAERARAGAARPDFPAGGPAEVRALTAAVSAMHDRLYHHAEQRTAMLAAIAHDLGTPLSRLAFWIEQLPDGARERAAADIDEMRAMIAETLRFARDEAGARDQTRVELGSLLESLADDMAAGRADAAVTVSPGPRAVVRGDPVGLRRVFANLADNAVRYGGAAAIGWEIDGAEVVVRVADPGPGLGGQDAERLFEPFVRGDPSRNRATGGTGLGLAIVRSIAGRHGGTVTLADRGDAAGAMATVRLPLAR